MAAGALSRADAAKGVGSLLRGAHRPTALICHNDLLALGVVGELRRRGLVPGQDLSVIGFDDIPESSHAVPALSTVATLPIEVGMHAARAPAPPQSRCPAASPNAFSSHHA